MEYALSTTSIVKTFGAASKAVHALQGVDIDVQKGEIFSLLGPNGAGKTTFIKCILDIVFPSSGDGSILGNPLGSIKAKERIGYLPENHRYPMHLTGGQALNYFGKLSGLSGDTLKSRVDETLGIVGMSEWRKTKIRKYSKGMMQRLGLAQALINHPDLIILDEPTDGVDPVGRKEIRDVLLHLKGNGTTVFLNSHLLSEVERISDRVAIMDHGKIIREGTVHDLTMTENRFEFSVESGSLPEAQTILGARLLTAQGSMLEVAAPDVQTLNKMIDELRNGNVLINSVQQKKSTLEDLFLSLISATDLHRQ